MARTGKGIRSRLKRFTAATMVRLRNRNASHRDASSSPLWAVVFRLLGKLINRPHSRFILSYRPDFDYAFGGFPEFSSLSAGWTRGNATNNLGDLGRLYLVYLNATLAVREGVPGNFAEIGVYKGNSAKVLHAVASRDGRVLYLFDTFAGFDPTQVQGMPERVRKAFADTDLASVQQFLGMDGIEYVPGVFPASLAGRPVNGPFAVVHIDCDLYEPMRDGLRYFYPLASPGAVFLLHDYGSGFWPGVKRAVDEFVADTGEHIVAAPDKSGTVMFRKSVG